jgi:GAF domain-containing protein
MPVAWPPVGRAPITPEFPASTPAPGPTARRGSSPRVREVGARVRGEELIADLFEAMHDLRFLPDAIEGGEFCLTLSMQEIPSQVGIVHLYDIDRREFVVTSARGANAPSLLLRRHPETDPMLASAMRGRRAVVIADAEQSDAATIDRYVAVGGARSVIVAPAMQAGRFLGAIELLNPLDGQPFTDSDGNAVLYIAEQFAEFVAARGIVTDPDRIAARRSR